MNAGLVVDNVSKQLDDKKILDGISFSVKPGKVLALVGHSGSGKTTLLKTINRLLDFDSGDIILNGRSIKEIDPIELRRRAGMVLQIPTMFDGTVKNNVEFGLRLRGQNSNAKAKVLQALNEAGLTNKFLNKDVNKLSGGEQQRVALARLLVLEPEVLLLDEPTAALDPKLIGIIEDTILKLCKTRQLITLWVTHNLAQARRVGNQIGILKSGKVKVIENTKRGKQTQINRRMTRSRGGR